MTGFADVVRRAGMLAAGRQQAGEHRWRVLAGPLRSVTLAGPHIERPSMVTGRYEPHVVKAMRTYVKPGTVAYDVGAHIGYLSLVLARLVGPHGSVVAYEADPTNVMFLRRNTAGGVVEHVEAAVSDTVGPLAFAAFAGYSTVGHISVSSEPDDATMLEVQATTIDAEVFDRGRRAPGFMKVDVEGAEVHVIDGAARTIRDHRPVLVVETREGDTLEPIAERLRVAHYTVTPLRSPLASVGVVDIVGLPG